MDSWEFQDPELRAAAGFPWPPSENAPILAAFGTAWKGATFDPSAFFKETPREGGIGAAVIYYLIIGILVAGATLFWDSLAFFGTGTDAFGADFGYGTVNPLVRFFLAPVFLVAGLFVSAGVVHLLLFGLRGSEYGFDTTLRVFCYSYSPAIFGVVPIVGMMIGGIWSLVLAIVGLREAHEVDTWMSVLAVLIPFIGAALVFGLMMAAVMAGSFLPAG